MVTKARTFKVDGKTVEIPATQRPVSHAEINRELTALKRMYNLAMENGKLAYRPTIKLLIEDNVRTGFFEADQFAAMLARLPAPVQPLVCTGIPERVAMKMTGRKTRSVFERCNIVTDSDLGTAAKLIDQVAGHTFGHSDAKIGAKAAQGTICDRQVSQEKGGGAVRI